MSRTSNLFKKSSVLMLFKGSTRVFHARDFEFLETRKIVPIIVRKLGRRRRLFPRYRKVNAHPSTSWMSVSITRFSRFRFQPLFPYVIICLHYISSFCSYPTHELRLPSLGLLHTSQRRCRRDRSAPTIFALLLQC